MDEGVLASSYPAIMNSRTGHPVVGIVYINKYIDYSLENTQEYFQSIIIHEFNKNLMYDYIYNAVG